MFHESRDERGILTITIDRPEVRNALSRAAMQTLEILLGKHASDATLRVLVLTGAGDRAFCAGGDLRDAEGTREPPGAHEFGRFGTAALDAIRRFPVPTVAALNGLAYGGGSELALACDMRIATADAEIGFIQSAMNISTAWGGGSDLMRLVGYGRAIEWLAFGQRFRGEAARAAGLFNAIAPAGAEFAKFTRGFIAPLAAIEPGVLRAIKAQAIAERFGLPVLEERAASHERFVATWLDPAHWARADRALKRN